MAGQTLAAELPRSLLDFGAPGLRTRELLGSARGRIEQYPHGNYWLPVTGNGKKMARDTVAAVLARYLADSGAHIDVDDIHLTALRRGKARAAN